MSDRAPCMTVVPGWLMPVEVDMAGTRQLPLAEIRAAIAAGDDVSIPAGEWEVTDDTVIYGGIKLKRGKLVLTETLVIAAPKGSQPTHSLSRA